MNKKYKRIILAVAFLGVAGVGTIATLYLGAHNIAVLNPKGTIADQQRQLMTTAVLLMAVVVVPVFALAFGIAWRYRAGNTKAKYSPDLAGNRWAETVWWLVPIAIICALAVITWQSSHDLDPFKPLASKAQPVHIQVIALDWKWLFIYPEQHIATVNFVQFPVNTPVDFDITADAPMNSLWIPQLAGQIYAMPGMSTQLHLMAGEAGDYRGSTANISGDGYAGMVFTARASTQADFDTWVASTQKSPSHLTLAGYNDLAKPTKNVPPAFYAFPASSAGLYTTTIMKYMAPSAQK